MYGVDDGKCGEVGWMDDGDDDDDDYSDGRRW